MIENIVFDIGGVILDWDIEYILDTFASNDLEKNFICDNIFNSPEWALEGLIDIGYISQYDFIKNVCDRTNHVNDSLVEKVILNYYQTFHIKEDVISLMKDLKNMGYKVYILSNINDYICEKMNIRNILKDIDGYVLSYEVHEIKPNAAIYKILLDKYNLEASKTLFLDDVEKNILTANKLGIQGRKVIKNSSIDIFNVLKEYRVLKR